MLVGCYWRWWLYWKGIGGGRGGVVVVAYVVTSSVKVAVVKVKGL